MQDRVDRAVRTGNSLPEQGLVAGWRLDPPQRRHLTRAVGLVSLGKGCAGNLTERRQQIETSSMAPALIFPGQRAMKGTPIPPCRIDFLRPFRPPVVPTEQPIPKPSPVAESYMVVSLPARPLPAGPLSELKTTSVLSDSFNRSSAASSSPIRSSACDRTAA